MKFGISQIHEEIYCENCKTLLSKEGFCNDYYCHNCGAPLRHEAVEEYVNNEKSYKKSVIEELNKIFEKDTKKSFKQIICDYLNNLD